MPAACDYGQRTGPTIPAHWQGIQDAHTTLPSTAAETAHLRLDKLRGGVEPRGAEQPRDEAHHVLRSHGRQHGALAPQQQDLLRMDPQRGDRDAEQRVDDQPPLQHVAQLQVLARPKRLAAKRANRTRQTFLRGA